LTPDSIKQKYAQTVVSTRIVPGCVLFLGEEKRFYTVWNLCGHIEIKKDRTGRDEKRCGSTTEVLLSS